MKKQDEFSELSHGNKLLLLEPVRGKLKKYIEEGNIGEVKKLIEEYGEDPLHKYNDWSLLHHATANMKYFNLDMIKYLVAKYPDAVNFQDSVNTTPFHYIVKGACDSKSIEMQQQIIEAVKYLQQYASKETIKDADIKWDFKIPELAERSENLELIQLVTGELESGIIGAIMDPEE